MFLDVKRDFSYIGWILQTFFAYWAPFIGLVILSYPFAATNTNNVAWRSAPPL